MNAQATSNEKITEALRLLEEAARDKKEEIQGLITNKYTNLREAVLSTEHKVADTLTAAGRQAVDAAIRARELAREKGRQVAADVDESAHENPWPYIGGAALCSLLIGFILGRNSK